MWLSVLAAALVVLGFCCVDGMGGSAPLHSPTSAGPTQLEACLQRTCANLRTASFKGSRGRIPRIRRNPESPLGLLKAGSAVWTLHYSHVARTVSSCSTGLQGRPRCPGSPSPLSWLQPISPVDLWPWTAPISCLMRVFSWSARATSEP